MGRKKANKINFIFSPWPADVTRSKAWEQLTNPARVAYPDTISTVADWITYIHNGGAYGN